MATRVCTTSNQVRSQGLPLSRHLLDVAQVENPYPDPKGCCIVGQMVLLQIHLQILPQSYIWAPRRNDPNIEAQEVAIDCSCHVRLLASGTRWTTARPSRRYSAGQACSAGGGGPQSVHFFVRDVCPPAALFHGAGSVTERRNRYPDRPIVWIKGFKPVVQTIVLNFFFNEYRSIFLLDLYFFSFHPPSGLFLFCKIRFKDYICFKNIFWIFYF